MDNALDRQAYPGERRFLSSISTIILKLQGEETAVARPSFMAAATAWSDLNNGSLGF